MAHIVHVIDRLNIGGAQSLLVTLAGAMQNRPHTMSVISLHHIDDMADQIRAKGASVTVMPGKLRDLGRLAAICRHLRKTKAAVIHTHLGYAHITGGICGRLTGLPVVSSLHSIEDHRMSRPWSGGIQRFERWCLRHLCDRTIAVGPRVAAVRAKQLGAERMVVIENAVAPAQELSAEQRAALRSVVMGGTGDVASRLLFIAVGRLSPEKGFSDLIEAFSTFVRSLPDAFLAIAGGGDLMTPLKAQVAALGMDNHVALLGPRSDVPALLAASDVLVMPSHWEGLPIAVLEGMAAGLPVVATAVGDLPNLISPEAGILVAPRDCVNLTKALMTVAGPATDQQAMGLAGQRLIEARFGATRWADRLCALYEEVMAKRCSRGWEAGAKLSPLARAPNPHE